MSADITTTPIPKPEPASQFSTAQATAAEQAAMQSMLRTMRKQRIQDFIFHKTTMVFALSVLLVLLGIIISRNSAPASSRAWSGTRSTTNTAP